MRNESIPNASKRAYEYHFSINAPTAHGSVASGCAASFVSSLFSGASCSILNLKSCEFSHRSSRSSKGSSPTGTSAIARVGNANSAFPLVADFTSRGEPTPYTRRARARKVPSPAPNYAHCASRRTPIGSLEIALLPLSFQRPSWKMKTRMDIQTHYPPDLQLLPREDVRRRYARVGALRR